MKYRFGLGSGGKKGEKYPCQITEYSYIVEEEPGERWGSATWGNEVVAMLTALIYAYISYTISVSVTYGSRRVRMWRGHNDHYVQNHSPVSCILEMPRL